MKTQNVQEKSNVHYSIQWSSKIQNSILHKFNIKPAGLILLVGNTHSKDPNTWVLSGGATLSRD